MLTLYVIWISPLKRERLKVEHVAKVAKDKEQQLKEKMKKEVRCLLLSSLPEAFTSINPPLASFCFACRKKRRGQ